MRLSYSLIAACLLTMSVAARADDADDGDFDVSISVDDPHATVSFWLGGTNVAETAGSGHVTVDAGIYKVVTRFGGQEKTSTVNIDGPTLLRVRTGDGGLGLPRKQIIQQLLRQIGVRCR